MLFAVETDRGLFLVEAYNKPQARKYMREEYGRAESIRKISTEKSDVEWGKAMGALIHDARGEK